MSETASSAVHVVSKEAGIDIKTTKVAHLVGEVHNGLAASFLQEILITSGIPGDRVILIDSPGGLVTAGDTMIEAIEIEKSRGIRQICVVESIAYSMAFNFLSHCDVRLALPKAKLMAHKIALGGIDCITQRCTAIRLQELVDDMRRDDLPYRKYNADAMHLTLKEYDIYADNDHIWSVDALRKLKYLHGVAAVQK